MAQISKCPQCRNERIRRIMDFKHILLGSLIESLWVCDNCFYRFKVKYKFNMTGPKDPNLSET